MTETTLSVPDISCDHCKNSIEGAVNALDGVASAAVNVEAKNVSVGFDAPASIEGIIDAIRQVQRGAAPINAYIAKKMLGLFERLAPPRAPSEDYKLTRREKEILELLVQGFTMRQIAERLHVSYHTVDNHIRNIYDKLHVHSRSGAVAKAIKERLL